MDHFQLANSHISLNLNYNKKLFTKDIILSAYIKCTRYIKNFASLFFFFSSSWEVTSK